MAGRHICSRMWYGRCSEDGIEVIDTKLVPVDCADRLNEKLEGCRVD
jgi:hypothetical protein